MENGVVLFPPQVRIFGDSFIQSVPLALLGMVAQIILYLLVSWWLLCKKPAKAKRNQVTRPA
jgi:hypothetical protein